MDRANQLHIFVFLLLVQISVHFSGLDAAPCTYTASDNSFYDLEPLQALASQLVANETLEREYRFSVCDTVSCGGAADVAVCQIQQSGDLSAGSASSLAFSDGGTFV